MIDEGCAHELNWAGGRANLGFRRAESTSIRCGMRSISPAWLNRDPVLPNDRGEMGPVHRGKGCMDVIGGSRAEPRLDEYTFFFYWTGRVKCADGCKWMAKDTRRRRGSQREHSESKAEDFGGRARS